jgi:hypothetical protein
MRRNTVTRRQILLSAGAARAAFAATIQRLGLQYDLREGAIDGLPGVDVIRVPLHSLGNTKKQSTHEFVARVTAKPTIAENG